MTYFMLERTQEFKSPLQDVFDFFAEPYNLERITPEFLKFSIVTSPPIKMEEGTRISYRLKLRGIPVKWTSTIMDWNPPFGFTDEQTKGPYKYWRHEHKFEENGAGTLVTDKIWYRVPGGPLAPILNFFYVRRDLQKIFNYRAETMKGIFD
jgi:ligand-binding SRPBCC domain-containing protein